jgi:hypothetical protein
VRKTEIRVEREGVFFERGRRHAKAAVRSLLRYGPPSLL